MGCVSAKPIVDGIEAKYAGKLLVLRVNVQDSAGEVLAREQTVLGTPTFIFFDAQFVKGHTLQPRWFKALKIFILLGFLAGYTLLFDWRKTLIFVVCFLLLMLLIHMAYPI